MELAFRVSSANSSTLIVTHPGGTHSFHQNADWTVRWSRIPFQKHTHGVSVGVSETLPGTLDSYAWCTLASQVRTHQHSANLFRKNGSLKCGFPVPGRELEGSCDLELEACMHCEIGLDIYRTRAQKKKKERKKEKKKKKILENGQ